MSKAEGEKFESKDSKNERQEKIFRLSRETARTGVFTVAEGCSVEGTPLGGEQDIRTSIQKGEEVAIREVADRGVRVLLPKRDDGQHVVFMTWQQLELHELVLNEA